jgi:glycerophosphoryl diester phosphodiesterase
MSGSPPEALQSRRPMWPAGAWDRRLASALFTVAMLLSVVSEAAEPLVIAHRGASGYLPEHTLAAQAMAVAQGADFIEQDVVLSRDGVPLVLHDITLDTVTDVAERFPGRARGDGRYYAIDFDLAEIRELRVAERRDPATGQPVFPARFPLGHARFAVATLAESIELIQGLEVTTGRAIGIYPEIKRPAWHRAEGQDISRRVLAVLEAYGYGATADQRLYLQCFDWVETVRIRRELGYAGPLVQLIGRNDWPDAAGTDYAALLSPAGLAELGDTVDAIGPSIGLVVDNGGHSTGLVERAGAHGLEVHAYTLRADRLPGWADDMAELTTTLAGAGVGGLFTDHPDLTRNALATRRETVEP